MVALIEQLLDLQTLLFVAAAALVIVIAAAVAFALMRGRRRPDRSMIQARRLGIVESLDLGPHRRLVILRRDAVEHLVLIGASNDLVVETNIERRVAQRFGDLPGTRGTRITPQDLRQARNSPGFDEGPDLDRTSLPPQPDRGANFSGDFGPIREPPPLETRPASEAFRATTPPAASQSRATSPAPQRRSPSPELARPEAQRGTGIMRANLPRKADPAKDQVSAVAPRSLSTPLPRTTPRSPVRAPEPVDTGLDAAVEPATAVESDQAGTAVPPPEQPHPPEASPRGETGPGMEAAPRDEMAGRPGEPEALVAATGDRDPIDRLEAEIARLLGRTSSG